MEMTQEQKKEAKKAGRTGILVIIILLAIGGAYLIGTNDIPAKTKAAIAIFTGDSTSSRHVAHSGTVANFPSPPKKKHIAVSALKEVEREKAPAERKRVVIDLFFWNTKNVFNATPIQREMILENKWQIAGPVLKELFKGPNEKEQGDGWTSAIKPGTTLEKVTIQDGTARVWIKTSSGETLRDSAAIEQIKRTLKQFQSVRRVEFKG